MVDETLNEVTITATVEGQPYPDEWTEREIKDYQEHLRANGIETLEHAEPNAQLQVNKQGKIVLLPIRHLRRRYTKE